jgi:hypothetical protein
MFVDCVMIEKVILYILGLYRENKNVHFTENKDFH